MRKTKLIFLVVSYLIVFGIGGYSYSFISLSESKQTGYLSETDRDKFIAFTKKIDEKFKPEGYEELLQGNENMLTTPDIILGPQQKEIETSIFGRQKNYSNARYNSPDNHLKAYYATVYASEVDREVGSYSVGELTYTPESK